MRGLVFHPLFCIVSISELYLIWLCVRAWLGNLSWQYVNSMNWTLSVGEGEMSVCIWFGAPSMHRVSGLNLAWHWHVVCGQVHLRSHYGIVCLGGLLLRFHALVSAKNLVCLLACNVWVMRCTALLCLAILRPFKYGCSHVDKRWGHVSLSLRWHNVQLGSWCVRGQKIFFLWLPIYCAYLDFSVWVIWASVTFSFFQKYLDSFLFIWVFDNHLST